MGGGDAIRHPGSYLEVFQIATPPPTPWSPTAEGFAVQVGMENRNVGWPILRPKFGEGLGLINQWTSQATSTVPLRP